jgi:hypothetical protein
VIGDSSLHCRRNAERFMHAAEVETGHIEIHGGAQMFERLAESKTQPVKLRRCVRTLRLARSTWLVEMRAGVKNLEDGSTDLQGQG